MTLEQIDIVRCEDGVTIQCTGYIASTDDIVMCSFTDNHTGDPFSEFVGDEEDEWRTAAACVFSLRDRLGVMA